MRFSERLWKVGETGESCDSFYSNPCSVKSIEYLILLFISLDSRLVALEWELTESCLMSEKIGLKWRVTTRPASIFVGRV